MSLLAQLYRTGQTKVASEGGDGEIDLSQISGEELLAGLADGSIVLEGDEPEQTKEAGGLTQEDLQNMSARDLLALLDAEEQNQEKVAEEQLLAQMQQDGSFDYFDTGGRIMAHSMRAELDKLASEEGVGDDGLPDEIEVDLDALTGDDLAQLIEAGYEFTDEDGEKTAGAMADRLRSAGSSIASMARRGADAAREGAGRYAASVRSSGRQARAGAKMLRHAYKTRGKPSSRVLARRGAERLARGAGGVAAKVGLPAAGAGGAAYAGYRAGKKK